MNISSDAKKALVIIPIFLVIGYFAYTYLANPSTPSEPLAADTGILGQDILIMVDKLRVISIDKAVFSGPLLTHLQDFSSAIYQEPQGKSNPFQPLITAKSK